MFCLMGVEKDGGKVGLSEPRLREEFGKKGHCKYFQWWRRSVLDAMGIFGAREDRFGNFVDIPEEDDCQRIPRL